MTAGHVSGAARIMQAELEWFRTSEYARHGNELPERPRGFSCAFTGIGPARGIQHVTGRNVIEWAKTASAWEKAARGKKRIRPPLHEPGRWRRYRNVRISLRRKCW